MIELEPGRVHVEFVKTALVPAHGWERLLRLLSGEEQMRAARFHFQRDRQAYVAGHALMRDMLARCTGRAARKWRFSTGAYGKPEAILNEGEPQLRINLSHTRGLATVAVTMESDLGVDVEWLAQERFYPELAERSLSAAERKYLAGRPPDERPGAFFALWTLKEAYIKATGLGLAMPLSDFAFNPEGPSIAFADHVEDFPAHWSFLNCTLSHAYALSVAVRRRGLQASDFTVVGADLARLLSDEGAGA